MMKRIFGNSMNNKLLWIILPVLSGLLLAFIATLIYALLPWKIGVLILILLVWATIKLTWFHRYYFRQITILCIGLVTPISILSSFNIRINIDSIGEIVVASGGNKGIISSVFLIILACVALIIEFLRERSDLNKNHNEDINQEINKTIIKKHNNTTNKSAEIYKNNTDDDLLDLYYRNLIEDHKYFNIYGKTQRSFIGVKLEFEKIIIPLRVAYNNLEAMRRNMSSSNHGNYKIIDFFDNKNLKKYRCIAVLGSPGSGKSTLLKSLIFKFNSNKDNYPIPVLFNLRSIDSASKLRPYPMLYDVIKNKDRSTIEIGRNYEHGLKNGNFLITFRGLEKITSPEESNKILNWIEKQANIYFLNKFVFFSNLSGGYKSQWDTDLEIIFKEKPVDIYKITNIIISCLINKYNFSSEINYKGPRVAIFGPKNIGKTSLIEKIEKKYKENLYQLMAEKEIDGKNKNIRTIIENIKIYESKNRLSDVNKYIEKEIEKNHFPDSVTISIFHLNKMTGMGYNLPEIIMNIDEKSHEYLRIYEIDKKVLVEIYKNKIIFGHYLVIFDGLDEIEDKNKYDEAVSLILNQMNRYSSNKYIVVSNTNTKHNFNTKVDISFVNDPRNINIIEDFVETELSKSEQRLGILIPVNYNKHNIYFKAENTIPVEIDATEIKKTMDTYPLLEEIINNLERSKNTTLPENFYQEDFRNGNCLIMLDGLDEVGDKDNRTKVTSWADYQMKHYSNNRFIITSRVFGYDENKLNYIDYTLETKPFNEIEREKFINSWYRHYLYETGKRGYSHYKTTKESANNLKKRIRKDKILSNMAGSPLLLTMMIIVHEELGVLPEKRVNFYKEACDIKPVCR